MTFSFKSSLKNATKSSFIILKLVVPIYIIADILFYYNLLEHITFLFEPITSFLGLPQESALSIVSGMFLNLYAAIAFAAPLELTPKEWTVLGVFLGIAHALIVETAVMKKIGISKRYSILLRIFSALGVAFLVKLMPESLFNATSLTNSYDQTLKTYNSITELISNSLYESLYLSFQIIVLITVLIFVLDYIKSLKLVQNYTNKVSSAFSITIGVILGITYGAGILINEYENNKLSKKEILYIGTFLMICHAIIEDTLLFVIFGANFWIIITFRFLFAFILAYIFSKMVLSHTDKLN